MDEYHLFQLLVSWVFYFPWIIDLILSIASLSSTILHLNSAGLMILCFIEFYMVSDLILRPTTNLRSFHWCTRRNWVPHKSSNYCLAPSGFYREKPIQVWRTQIKCTLLIRRKPCVRLRTFESYTRFPLY